MGSIAESLDWLCLVDICCECFVSVVLVDEWVVEFMLDSFVDEAKCSVYSVSRSSSLQEVST